MAKKEVTRPILVQEEAPQLTEFTVEGIDFIVLDLNTQFTVRRDQLMRKTCIGINDNNLIEKLNPAEILSLCVQRKGEKWNEEQHKLNIELFEDTVFRQEWQEIIQRFFDSVKNLIMRGFPTS